ncbi:MAG: hypothetical protein M1282_15055 [Chloroflexi bacterium]|nr:hypothetical protein [Chloroflexota bacterium]
MKKTLNRIITTLLLATIPTVFCAVISTPISYAIPLQCPPGSHPLNISCVDPADHDTTPWYRRDIGPSILTLPIWLVISLGAAWALTRTPALTKAMPTPEELEMDESSRRWLPPECPYCGGTLSPSKAKWLNHVEAK